MKKSDVTKNYQTLPVVLIGMMGAGKSSVGRALAKLMGLPFHDADSEIEAAAGRSPQQIFEEYGEAEFRRLERQVIARLLEGPRCVLSLGGGAFMEDETRARVEEKAFSVWLKVDRDLLVERVLRHGERPMLKGGDPRERMATLLDAREPVYAGADLTVLCDDRPVAETAKRVLAAMQAGPESQIPQA
ncbi:MAG: shikimate kinase [Alphaproteobacteria bacterium]|nr:shikimate kinase [Alphaproteobacteria bacterium]